MKVNRKIKIFCHLTTTIGVFFWSVILLLEGASIQKSALICLISLVGLNSLLWFAFKVKEGEKV